MHMNARRQSKRTMHRTDCCRINGNVYTSWKYSAKSSGNGSKLDKFVSQNHYKARIAMESPIIIMGSPIAHDRPMIDGPRLSPVRSSFRDEGSSSIATRGEARGWYTGAFNICWIGTQLLDIADNVKITNGGQNAVVTSVSISRPLAPTKAWAEMSIPAHIAMSRHRFNQSPPASISRFNIAPGLVDGTSSLQLAALPVTKEPLGLLPNRWNWKTAYRCTLSKRQFPRQ